MKALNARQQKSQEDQAARQEDLEKGRIRIVRPEERRPSSSEEPQEKTEDTVEK